MQFLRWNRVAFGLTCSPFLLGATIRHHLLQVPDNQQWVADEIRENLYVDNLPTGAADLATAKKLIKETCNIFVSAKMTMRKGFNRMQRRAADRPWSCESPWNQVEPHKLPIYLRPEKDFELAAEYKEKLTKRQMLSTSAKIFDPLGFIAPAVVQLKLLFQDLWRAEVGWDEEVPVLIAERWRKAMVDLKYLENVTVPRRYNHWPDQVTYELHIFCDASLSRLPKDEAKQ